jgi:methyl-accepting chemotaxis protein
LTDPILYKDILKIDGIISEEVKDEDVVYIFVYDDKGNLLNTPSAGLDLEYTYIKSVVGNNVEELNETKIQKLRKDLDSLEVSYSIKLDDGTNIGKIFLGLSLKNVRVSVFRTTIIMIFVTFIVIVFQTIVIIYLFRKLVTKPIYKLNDFSHKVALGDLTSTCLEEETLEINSLINSINRISASLREIIKEVVEVSKNAKKSSHDVADNASKVVEGAERQKASINESLSVLETIGNSISDMKIIADSLKDSVELASSTIIQLTTSIQMVSENVNKFNQSAVDAASSVEEMVRDSKKYRKLRKDK